MGAGLVKAVFVLWPMLDPIPKLLLLRMAAQALDKDRPPVFYGGREALAAAIGKVVPDAPARTDQSPEAREARRVRENAFTAVKHGLKPLKDAGIIVLTNDPQSGIRANYELRIPLVGGRSSTPAGGVSSTPTSGEQGVDERPARGWMRHPPRRKEQEYKTFEEEKQEDGSSQVTNSPASSTGNGHPDDHRDEASRQHAALLAWERGHQPDPTP